MANVDVGTLELLARRAGEGSDPAREASLLLALPADRQAAVVERLRVLDAFMTAQDAGVRADADKAADDLKIARRTVYRLVQKIREKGGVSALAPMAEAGRKRRSDAGSTLAKEVTEAIGEQILRFPSRSLGELVAAVREIDPTAAPSTVRRYAERLQRKQDPVAHAHFGRHWLLDQAAVGIVVERGGTTSWLVATFLVDVETKLIIGRSFAEGQDDPGLGAVIHGLSRADALLERGPQLASGASEITWAVPDGMRRGADAVALQGATLSPPVRVTAITGDKFRRGRELSKLMGGQIGGARLLVRSTPDPRMTPGPRDPTPLDEASARAFLDASINFANAAFFRYPPAPTDAPTRASRAASLQKVFARLVEAFAPVLGEARNEEAGRLVAAIYSPPDDSARGEPG